MSFNAWFGDDPFGPPSAPSVQVAAVAVTLPSDVDSQAAGGGYIDKSGFSVRISVDYRAIGSSASAEESAKIARLVENAIAPTGRKDSAVAMVLTFASAASVGANEAIAAGDFVNGALKTRLPQFSQATFRSYMSFGVNPGSVEVQIFFYTG